jgi:hypothetical protein
MSDHQSLRFTLLDQQIIDAEDRPVGRVDDVVLELPADGGPPEVVAVLTGAQALGESLGGLTGRLMASVAARLRTGEQRTDPTAIPAWLIGGNSDLVKLTVPIRNLPQTMGWERWLAHHVVEGLPGAGDARD